LGEDDDGMLSSRSIVLSEQAPINREELVKMNSQYKFTNVTDLIHKSKVPLHKK
jgi:hypothetical protein